VERIEEETVVKRVYRAKLEGRRGRVRLKLRWMDDVGAAVEWRGVNITYCKMCM
jgi:hypothetical protein